MNVAVDAPGKARCLAATALVAAVRNVVIAAESIIANGTPASASISTSTP